MGRLCRLARIVAAGAAAIASTALLAICAGAQAGAGRCPPAASESVLPWASFAVAGARADVVVDATGVPVRLRGGGIDLQIPEGMIPLAVLPRPGEATVVLARESLLGYLAVLVAHGDRLVPLSMELDDRINLYLQHALVLGGRIFAVVYDVQATLPSGRRRAAVSDAHGLYELKIAGDAAQLLRIGNPLPTQGIDVTILETGTGDRRIVCSQSHCMSLALPEPAEAPVVEPITLAPAGHPHAQLVELAGDGHAAWGLLQGDYDDRFVQLPPAGKPHFSLCRVGGTECRDIEPGRVPFRLRVEAGEPVVDLLAGPADAERLLDYDLSRLRGNGLANFGESNLEGRIAWSAVYHLNGLITLAARSPPDSAFPALRDKAARRVCAEMRRLEVLAASSYPWLLTKRYSLAREPITSVVHLGRVARLGARFAAEIDASTFDVAPLAADLGDLRRTIEHRGPDPARTELVIRRGVPFWADGSNVAWNIQSAWIEGLATTGVLGRDARLADDADRMIARLLADERIAEGVETWRYGAGRLREGWQRGDLVSVNTPSWGGNKTTTETAHVSYRSMDAMALLAALRAGRKVVPPGLVAHVRKLTEEGWLYPFTAEELILHGAPPRLSHRIARVHARSVLPWQVQSQVWALAALTRDPP